MFNTGMMQQDPNTQFTVSCINILDQVLRQMPNVPAQLGGMLMTTLNINNPACYENIGRFMNYIFGSCQQSGINLQNGVSNDILAQIIAPWAGRALQQVQQQSQQMQQPSFSGIGFNAPGGGGFGGGAFAGTRFGSGGSGSMMGGPAFGSNQNATPAAPFTANGPMSGPSPSFSGSQPMSFQPTTPSSQAARSATPSDPVSSISLEFRKVDDPDLVEDLEKHGFRLLHATNADLPGNRTIRQVHLESRQAANSEVESALSSIHRLPDILTSDEFVIQIVFSKLESIQLSTESFIKFGQAVKGRCNNGDMFRAFTETLNDNPRGLSTQIEEFVVAHLNDRLMHEFRIHADPGQKIWIEEVDDYRQVLDGKLPQVFLNDKLYKTRAKNIFEQTMSELFFNPNIVTTDDQNLGDLLRCDQIDYYHDGLTKYDAAFQSEAERNQMLEVLFGQNTLLRLRRAYQLTNTLDVSDLNAPDLWWSDALPFNQQVYWNASEFRPMSSRETSPYTTKVICYGNTVHDVVDVRQVVRCLETHQKTDLPIRHLMSK